MPLNFYKEDTNFRLRNINKIKKWINSTIVSENCFLGEISIILCSDLYLSKLNIEFLNRDNLTDVIAFDYSESNSITGDVFISIERIKENSKLYKVSLHFELLRVIIHGILHLIGYRDKESEEKKLMTAKEDYYLKLYTGAKFL